MGEKLAKKKRDDAESGRKAPPLRGRYSSFPTPDFRAPDDAKPSPGLRMMRAHRNVSGGRGYWVLKGRVRDFYICASARPHEKRAALCVFDSGEAAGRHLCRLGEARMFLDTLERYGKSLPAWMRDESLSPEAREVSAEELGSILANTGVAYVAMNPPLGEGKTLELLPSCNFIVAEGSKTCGK